MFGFLDEISKSDAIREKDRKRERGEGFSRVLHFFSSAVWRGEEEKWRGEFFAKFEQNWRGILTYRDRSILIKHLMLHLSTSPLDRVECGVEPVQYGVSDPRLNEGLGPL